jgi:CRP/FNR family nitrogen fixation transcriptional regulator
MFEPKATASHLYQRQTSGRARARSVHPLPGDMFGFENRGTHRFSAEALVETRARIMRRRSLLDTMANREGSTTELLRLITQSLQHAENHMLLLGRKTALERVVAFLLEMDDRKVHPNVMVLPMSRRDIGDYLGLTVETVSRAFSILRDEEMLRFIGTNQRLLVLLNRTGLAQRDA